MSGVAAALVGVRVNGRIRWNEWITLPIRYCDLPLNSQITFTVWDISGPRSAIPVGGTTFRLFGKKWSVDLMAWVY